VRIPERAAVAIASANGSKSDATGENSRPTCTTSTSAAAAASTAVAIRSPIASCGISPLSIADSTTAKLRSLADRQSPMTEGPLPTSIEAKNVAWPTAAADAG
jgi:hypothetical protein